MSIVGKYELLSDPADPAWDDYLIAIGMSDEHREAGRMVKWSVEISQAGGKYTLKSLSELKNTEVTFAPGQEVDETMFDDRHCKTVFKVEGSSKLVQQQRFDGTESKIVREFAADSMTATFSAQQQSAVRKYKRVA